MTQRRAGLDPLAAGLLVGCCFLWGLNQVAVKLALPELPALVQAAARSLGAALLVLLWSRARGIALFERDGSLRGGLLAGLLFAAEFACIFTGLQYTSASRMVVFIYLSPFVVALGMPFIAHSERLSGWQIGGLVAAFGGVAWAFAGGFADPVVGPQQLLGDALGRAGRAAVGRHHARDPRHPTGCRVGREDAVLPAGGVWRWHSPPRPGRPTSTGRPARRCWPGRRSDSRP